MTEEKVKELTARYPYLIPRNIWTDKEVENYTYVRGEHELPQGWFNLFLQMCEDIRQPLIDAGYFDKFRFTQIKEKYNTMRCYNFGAPEAVRKIIQKYEIMSQYICTRCGKVADYETSGYIESFCADCWKNFIQQDAGELITPKTYFYVEQGTSDGKWLRKRVSFKREWNKYLKKLGG